MRTAYASLSPEQRDIRQQQNSERRRITRLSQEFDNVEEQFSIDMMSIPNSNQLQNHEQDPIKALFLWHENSVSPLLDQMNILNDAYQHASGDSLTEAEDTFLNVLDELKITRETQHKIQCRFNSIHDRYARIIGCCCCGISCILPTVSEEGNILPPLELKQFPTHTLFGPLKFTVQELAEWNLQSESKQMVRSTKLAHDGQQYHVHQELITEQQVG
jgi:hypothetical protein